MKNEKPKAKKTQTLNTEKSVSSKSTQTSKNDCNECVTLGAVGLVVLIFSLVFGGYYYFTNPNFELGDCVISRDYKYFRVQDIDSDDEYYDLAELMPVESYSGWYLSKNYEGEQRYKSIDSADDSYVEVPCYR